MTGANYTGGKRWVSQSVYNTDISQTNFFLPGTLPEHDFAIRLVVLRKATLVVGALRSLAGVWETAHIPIPRRKSHLAYLESFSNMPKGIFHIYQNICTQTGRKNLSRFLSCHRLLFQNTLSNHPKLCTDWTVRAVSPSDLIQFFSRLVGTFSQRSFPQRRSGSCSQVFKNCWTLQLSKFLPKV